jgi:hypothetical protein
VLFPAGIGRDAGSDGDRRLRLVHLVPSRVRVSVSKPRSPGVTTSEFRHETEMERAALGMRHGVAAVMMICSAP